MTRVFEPDCTTLPQGHRLIMDEPMDPVWDGMSRMDFLRIAMWTRQTADSMGLRDWKIQLKWEQAEDGVECDCYARCTVYPTIWVVSIWLCRDFAILREHEQRRALTHELIHVHLDRLYKIGDQSIHKYMGEVGYELFSEEFTNGIETVTEAMGANWSAMIPSIPYKIVDGEGFDIILRDGMTMPIIEFLDQEPKEQKDAD